MRYLSRPIFWPSLCLWQTSSSQCTVLLVSSIQLAQQIGLLRPSSTERRLSDRSVCLSICEQAYWRRNEPISLKLGVMTGPTNRNNWLTFGGAPVPDVDCGSLFHFPHHCGRRDLKRFISISHTGTPRPDFYATWRSDWRRQRIKFTTFWEIWGRHPDLD